MRRSTVILCALCPFILFACNPSPDTRNTGSPNPPRPITTPRPAPPTTPVTEPPKPPAVDWSKVGTKATVGDVEIEVLWVGVTDYSTERIGGLNQYCATVWQFKLSNTSAAKIRQFDGWTREGKMTDEHGNEFKSFSPAGRFVSHPIPDAENKAQKLNWPYIIAGDLPMHPGKAYGTYLLFDEVPKPSKELRLTLPASAVGGEGELHFRWALTFRRPFCDRN